MGKIVVLFVVLIGAITTTLLTGVNERSEEIPKMLSGNFQDIGSYALQYAINQVVTGEVKDNKTTNFVGINEFEVLDGQIDKIRYEFASTSTSAQFVDDDPTVEGADDGAFIYDVSGLININPGNSDNTEFYMETSDGTIIDRSIIHTNAPEFSYDSSVDGTVDIVKFKPKALGRILKVNDVDIELNMSARYTLQSDSMSIRLWNDHIKNGKAMGHWWIEIDGPNSILELDPGIPLEDFVEDYTWNSEETFTHMEVKVLATVSMNVQGKTITHDCFAGAVVIVAENEDGFWWTVNEEDSAYKIIYWNP